MDHDSLYSLHQWLRQLYNIFLMNDCIETQDMLIRNAMTAINDMDLDEANRKTCVEFVNAWLYHKMTMEVQALPECIEKTY